MIASVMDSFEEQNQNTSPQVLLTCCKTCKILLQNALTKQGEQYRKVKLGNPKIQQRVVSVPGALGLLQTAGFVNEGEFLVYSPPENDSGIGNAIVAALDLKIQEWEAAVPKVVPKQQGISSSEEPSPFLSEEERRKRSIKAKEARKKKAAERALTRQRLEEDKQERLERLKNEELAKKAAAATGKDDAVSSDVFIRRQHPFGQPLASPMTDARANQPTGLARKRSFDESVSNQKQAMLKEPAQDAEMMDADEDRKPAGKPDDAFNTAEWNTCLEHLPRCCTATGIRDTSIYRNKAQSLGGARPQCLKKLLRELSALNESLPTEPAIWLRFDEETPQFLRALITAPTDTPYSFGLFCFDIYIPDTYPEVPPKMQLLTTGGGSVRFSPNLYADGKVCLSLLGTWPGPKWNPLHSSIFQVLVSIQGLILGVEHPYFLEPGHGGWEGKVQEGKFQVEGTTLSGTKVSEEIGVPEQVVAFEDPIRLGTVDFAMLDTLKVPRHVAPFEKVIHAHFYHHRSVIMTETQKFMGSSSSVPYLGRMKASLTKLKERLSRLTPPTLAIDEQKSTLPSEAEPVAAEATARSPSEAKNDMDVDDLAPKSDGVEAMIAIKRKAMEEAASKGDFVGAGNLQSEIQHLEDVKPQLQDLERRIAEAAANQDFIRAGRFQEQYQALVKPETAASKTSAKNTASAGAAMWNQGDPDSDVDMWDQGDDELGMGMPPPFMGQQLGASLPSNVYAPPSIRFSGAAPKDYQWGSGNALHATASMSTEVQKPAAVAKKAPIPRDRLCRLRIRLPDNRTVLEDFDQNDHLSTVYRHLESLMPSDEENTSTLTPLNARSGAFSQPLSSAGFTLLLSHPKREFNLEMHGTKSLAELNLAPSATLVVMMCHARGVVHRGELEARLKQAQGNAMELSGLSYEGLVELTERVGTAAPPDGAVSLTLSEQDLERNSTLISPRSYLATGVPDEEQKCPICLGQYSSEEESKCLRKLNHCGHIFHDACFFTWIRTKSSCPLCKASIVE